MTSTDLLTERLRRDMPRSQEAALLMAARLSVAKLGPATTEQDIRRAAFGLASGLFGEAFTAADLATRKSWVELAEVQYRKAVSTK